MRKSDFWLGGERPSADSSSSLEGMVYKAPKPKAIGKWEWGGHPDRGCAMAPACLTCPLPKCIHDLSQKEVRAITGARFDKNGELIR
jgi:hypothetical protein